MSTEVYEGGCYCGAVRFIARPPVLSAQVCHCSTCRRLQSASLGVLACFFAKDALDFSAGKDKLAEYLSPKSYSRLFCTGCGTRIGLTFEKAPIAIPMVGLYPTVFDKVRDGGALPEELRPRMHIYYAERLFDILDGVDKFADTPEQWGGSGKRLDDRGAPLSS